MKRRATTGRATTIKSFTGLFVSFVLFAEQTTTLSCDNGLSFQQQKAGADVFGRNAEAV